MLKSKTELFLASRFEEFKELRGFIAHEIQELQEDSFDVVLVDLNDGDADSRPPIARSLETLQNSEIVILLLGDSYGGIPDGYSKSYTHLEYEEALQQQKDILVYCIGDSYAHGGDIEFSEHAGLQSWQESILLHSTPAFYPKEYDKKKIAKKIRNAIAKKLQAYTLNRVKTTESESCTNKRSKLTKSLTPRTKEIGEIGEYFSQHSDDCALLYITGNAGIGKSSLLIDFYYATQELFHTLLFFTPDDIEDDENLDILYRHLLKRFHYIMQGENYFIHKLENIDEESHISDKINKLFELYTHYYEKNKTPFILILDSIESFHNEKSSIAKILHPNRGVHFLFSSRNNTLTKYLKQQKREFDFFRVYTSTEGEYGYPLKSLDTTHIIEIISSSLHTYSLLSNNDAKEIEKLLITKSDGLPLYLNYQINSLNTKIEKNDHLFFNLKSAIEKMPNRINDFYIDIFENMNDTALHALQILYWSSDSIKKKTLYSILKLTEKEYIKLEESISFLLHIELEFVAIGHLSVKEALFHFYAKDANHKPLATKLNAQYLKEFMIHENPIFEYVIPRSSIMDNFSRMVYFSKENILFKALQESIHYYLSHNYSDAKLLNLMYEFSKILYLNDNINEKHIYDTTLPFSTLFDTFHTSQYLTNVTNKFFSLMLTRPMESTYELNRLIEIAIIAQNNYFISKYLKQLLEYNYNKLLDTALNSNELIKKEYEALSSILMQSYVTRVRELEHKEFYKGLTLYDDNNTVLYVTNKKEKYSIEQALFMMLRAKSKKKQVYLQFYRPYQAFMHTTNIKLLHSLNKSIYTQLKFYKKNATYNTEVENLQKLSNEIRLKLTILKLKNFNKEDADYKYMSQEYKNRCNRVKQLYTLYLQNGLNSLIGNKTDYDLLTLITPLINDSDKVPFFHAIQKRDITQKEIYDILNILIHTTTERTVLTSFRKYIVEKKYKHEKILLIFLTNINYKLQDLEALLALKPYIIEVEYKQKERTMLQNIIPSLDAYTGELYERFPFKNGYDKALSNQLIDGESFIDIITTMQKKQNYQFLSKTIDNYLKVTTQPLSTKKMIFKKYKNYLDTTQSNTHILNILYEESIDDFFTIVRSKLSLKEQLLYLKENIKILLRSTYIEESDTLLWEYIIEIYLKNSLSSEMVELYKTLYNRKRFTTFALQNPQAILQLYQKIANDASKTAQEIYPYIWANYLITQGEESYLTLFEQDWYKMASFDEVYYLYFIFYIQTEQIFNHFLENINNANELTLGKIYLYGGFKYNNEELLQKGIDIANKCKNQPKNNLNYTIIYTIQTLLQRSTKELLSLLMVPHYHSSDAMQHFFNLAQSEDFANNKENIYKIKTPAIFMKTFLNYFVEGKELSEDDFISIDSTLLTQRLLILYDRYKSAERNGNEEQYEKCELLFSQLKQRLSSLHSASLDRLFEEYDFDTLTVEEDIGYSIDIKLLEKGYKFFYTRVEEIYEEYLQAKEEEDESTTTKIEESFQRLKEELSESQEHLDILIENSQITNKLQIKVTNFALF